MSNSLWSHGLPGSSVHGISQARILEWVAISFPTVVFLYYELFRLHQTYWVLLWVFILKETLTSEESFRRRLIGKVKSLESGSRGMVRRIGIFSLKKKTRWLLRLLPLLLNTTGLWLQHRKKMKKLCPNLGNSLPTQNLPVVVNTCAVSMNNKIAQRNFLMFTAFNSWCFELTSI